MFMEERGHTATAAFRSLHQKRQAFEEDFRWEDVQKRYSMTFNF
jgi:hypothetical protein